MKTQKAIHVGNIILAFDRSPDDPASRIFLGHKPPKNKQDGKRSRKRIGIGRWVPPGGGTDPEDRSQKHAAQRELFEESGDVWKIPLGNLCRVGVLESYQGTDPCADFKSLQLVWLVHIYETVIPESLRDSFRIGKGFDKAQWFPSRNMPWDNMMASDEQWLARVIEGKQARMRFIMDFETGKVCRCDITPKQFSPKRNWISGL